MTTVSMFVKYSHAGMITREMLSSWFSNRHGNQDEKVRVFLNLNALQTKDIINRAVDAFGKQYYTFHDIINNQRPCLDEFYIIIEQIACWFSQEARGGYDGGGSIVNRSRTENT